MSIATYCFISVMATIAGLIVLITAITVLKDCIEMYKLNKRDKKNREEFIDWLMTHFKDSRYYYKSKISNDDEFCYIGAWDEVYTLYKLNDSLCDCVRKRGEEENK